MKRIAKKIVTASLLGLIFCFAAIPAAFAGDGGNGGSSIVRIGYMEGIGGGNVGDKGALAGGYEYEFFQRRHQALSISFDALIDRTAARVNRPLVPVLLNYRYYLGRAPLSGFYVSAGLGEAIPFWDWHGGANVAWQGSLGYSFSGGGFLELRYIGRPADTILRDGRYSGLNNTFVGATTGWKF